MKWAPHVDVWSKFRLGPEIRTTKRAQSGIRANLAVDPRSTVCSKSANPLDLPEESAIRVVDPKTFSRLIGGQTQRLRY